MAGEESLIQCSRSTTCPLLTQCTVRKIFWQLASFQQDKRRSLLHTASGSGHADLVSFLLTRGAKALVNEADDEVGSFSAAMQTALMCWNLPVPAKKAWHEGS